MDTYIAVIKQINWFNIDNTEAEVLFEIDNVHFWAFCYPCNFREGERITVHLSYIEDEISDFSFWNENRDKKKEIVASEDDKWRYYCYGYLKSINPVKIDCGNISFSFGDWTNDEKVIGSYVYFVISRLNIC